MKVLAVDDHPLIREALRYVLKALDPSVELLEAQNLSEARDLSARHEDISLTLLDLGLPGTAGFAALRELRELRPDIPVVVLSASDDPDTVLGALDEGAMGFIPKASKNDVLVNALRLVLSGGVYLPAQALRQDAPQQSHVVPPAQSISYRDVGLTERQAEVLALLIQGKPNKLICRELDLAEGTVKIHVTAILKALKVTNRTQAVVAVSRLGLKLDAIRSRPGLSAGHP